MSQPSSSAGIKASIPAIPAAIPDTAENTSASIETCDTNVTESNQPPSYAKIHKAHDTTSITTLTTIDATAIGNARRFNVATTARTLRATWNRDRDPEALGAVALAIMGWVAVFVVAFGGTPTRLWFAAVEALFVYALAVMIHYRHLSRAR